MATTDPELGVSAWQPIATAPKIHLGFMLIGSTKKGLSYRGYWDKDKEAWYAYDKDVRLLEDIDVWFRLPALPPYQAPPRVDVTVGDGKYCYVFPADGFAYVLRHGEKWDRDVVGDGFVLALAQEIVDLREELAKERKARRHRA